MPPNMRGRGQARAAGVRLYLGLAALLAGVWLTGCSLGADPAAPPQLGSVHIPDIAALADKIQTTFKIVKLTGDPQVSPVRQAAISAFGDWRVCLRSDANDDPRIYALMIQNDAIVDYRLALAIDGCAREQFAPLPTASAYK